jgi:hypothetical protein
MVWTNGMEWNGMFNTNRRDVLHQGVYQEMDESMSFINLAKTSTAGYPT